MSELQDLREELKEKLAKYPYGMREKIKQSKTRLEGLRSKTDEDIQSEIQEERRKLKIIGIYAAALATTPILGTFAWIAAVWLHPRKAEPIFLNRLKSWKNYGFRAFCTVLLIPIGFLQIQAFSAPVPVIEINDRGQVEGGKNYAIEIVAKEAETITISSDGIRLASQNGERLSQAVHMESLSKTLEVTATNGIKKASKTFMITRKQTSEEIESAALAAKSAEEERQRQQAAEAKCQKDAKCRNKKLAEEAARKERERISAFNSEARTWFDANRGEVWEICKEAVKAKLKSPSTADFPWPDFDNQMAIENARILVGSYVDAKNSFGVPLRSNFVCDFQYAGNGNVKLQNAYVK